MNTKTVLMVLGLAALTATPALARHVHRAPAAGPYASAPGALAAPVVSDGRVVIGTDPDPQIRFELERDSATYTSTN
jgi:putative intracellular protease/amidase